MKVRAKELGFFGRIIEKGREFTIEHEKQFSNEWMERLDAEASKPEPAPVNDAPAEAVRRGPGRPRKVI